ncbi:MAG: acetate/propionate family kinase [Thermoleophilaceae bacterium]
MRVLVVNAGSSSLKLGVVEDGEALAAVDIPAPRSTLDEQALQSELDRLAPVDAVGHRIVHGGRRFVEPVLVDDEVVAELHALAELAPLHQEKSLAALHAVQAALPGIPAVACFDTAFHATLPAAAATYALPAEWRERWGLRRYGFHGLSHAYAARRTAELTGARRIVTCHLGAGASLAAVRDGRSVDTTMGFTPLEGLVMATRSGSVDPGLLLWLLEHAGMSATEMAKALEHDSGLAALAGTADMREVVARAWQGDERAGVAFDVYVHRLRLAMAAMAASLGGLEALTFTGGVGEHSAPVRAAAIEGLAFLGLEIDVARNDTVSGELEISSPGAKVRTLVVPAREDLEIARGVEAVLSGR